MHTTGIKVSKKQKRNEANVHALLYTELHNEKIEVYSEYRINNSRCDLVIVKDDLVKCAIEVKRRNRKDFNTGTRQFKKYEELNIPVIYCMGKNNINSTVELVKEKMLRDVVEVDMYVLNSK